MTVCMITPDISIDRRILLEAKSLADEGNEVLVISSMDAEKTLPEYEMQDGVKIRRFSFNGADPRLMFMYVMINFVLNKAYSFVNRGHRVLNRLSSWKDRTANFFLAAAAGVYAAPAIGAPGRLLLRFPYLALRAAAGVFASSVSRALLFTGKLLNLSYRAFARGLEFIKRYAPPGLRIISGVSAYDTALYREAATYRYDVYHAHDLPSLIPAYLAAKKHGSHLFYDAHELYPEIITLPPGLKKRCGRIERNYIGKADQVTTVNEFIAREMGKRYGIETPEVLLNCTNIPANFDPHRKYELIRKSAGIPPEDVIVLFQGWVSPHRGLEALVKAAAMVQPGIVLVFMGYGEYKKDLAHLASESGARDRVFFIDAVGQDVLLQWTSSADVGIIPYQGVDLNTRFCSPNKLFEFIAAGLPVLANDLPFLRKMVDGQGIGQVAALDDARSYARAIDGICAGREKLASYRENAIRASATFNWEVEGKKLLELYRKFDEHE